MPLSAFGGDASLKLLLRARIAQHIQRGELEQGGSDGSTTGRGGAVWAIVGSVNNGGLATLLGIPVEVCRLYEGIFEGLNRVTALGWPDRFLAAINVGADLTNVWPSWCQWLLGTALAQSDPLDAPCATMAALFGRWVTGGVQLPLQAEWDAALVLAQGDLNAALARRRFAASAAVVLSLPLAASASPLRPAAPRRALAAAAQAATIPSAFWISAANQLETIQQAAA
jgi:hypothetical protein